MVITKTKFINYIRCPRYCALDEIKEEELEADVSFEGYQEEEKEELLGDLYNLIQDQEEEENDASIKQLEAMLSYYLEIEKLALKHVLDMFGGYLIPNSKNKNQESFDFMEAGIKYLCYVDIYREHDDGFDIFEVKATTSQTFLSLGPKIKGEKHSLFYQDQNGVYYLKEEIKDYQFKMPLKKYLEHKKKLLNKYSDSGKYVYDLLVQRMIIEGYLKENNQEDKIDKIKYYLAVLNHEYVFDGLYDELKKPIYNKDQNNHSLISLFDFTKLTSSMMDKINLDKKQVYNYLKEMNIKECDLGIHCEFKKTTKCKFIETCFYKQVPKENSILNYMGYHHGFKDPSGYKYDAYELINLGKREMLSIDESLLTRLNNIIQRRTLLENKPYINKKKINLALKELEYPLYHLDFETFPCPLPRYKGEKCYTQSPFQFSLHIEKEPGVCDKDQDHYEYLASSYDDLREELVKKLIEYIDTEKGMIIVYNQSFEKGRLQELADLYPEYRKKLLKMKEMVYDLLYIIKNNSTFYKEIGLTSEEVEVINYYHPLLNGSYSIKKVLPIFAKDLNYGKLDVSNGIDALVTYASFSTLPKEEFKIKYQSLLEYCKQDTWAMVVILKELRKLVK